MPNLSLSGLIAEAQSDPLVVELVDGKSIRVIPARAISADRLDRMLALVETWENATTDRDRLRLGSEIIRLVVSEDDWRTWVELDPPMTALAALIDAVTEFYEGAGSLGEGRASGV